MFFVERLLAFVAPHDCLNCGKEGSLLCLMCVYDCLEPVPGRCYRCLRLSQDSAVCKTCRRSTVLKNVWVVTEYADVAKRLVQLLKFERGKSAAQPISSSMAGALPYLERSVVMTFVPTATSRQRSRGYDQSELIAKTLSKQKGVNFVPTLGRLGQSRQVGSTRAKRFSQAEQMFFALKSDKIKGAHVVIVDDIVTTGASLEAAAKILRKAGAKQVSAVVFAQKR